jgi:hypothetical protein
MAGIYVSYRSADKDLVDGLVPLLERRGHRVVFDWGLHIGASWRDELMTGLLTSDAVLVVWGETTHHSQYVPAEVGAARATGNVAVLPVVVEPATVPPFLQDLFVEHVGAIDPGSLEALAAKLDASIRHHVERRDAHKAGRPKIFISHRHIDHVLVQRLIDCITTYFDIASTDIRATSVAPYRLRVGENTSERLRRDIADAEVVLGVLGADTMDSVYVAFELGSAWGQGIWTCPLLAGGADESHIPGPIRDLSPLHLSNPRDCHQLLQDLATAKNIQRRAEVRQDDIAERVQRLVEAARPPAP